MQDEWFGKTVRIFITKVDKLDIYGNAWESKFVLMARKKYAVDIGNGMPILFEDFALSEEYDSLEKLKRVMNECYEGSRHAYPSGTEIPKYEFLDIFKVARVHFLDVEIAAEQAASNGSPLVKLCLSKRDDLDCEAYEDEYAKQVDMMDPHKAPQPTYRER